MGRPVPKALNRLTYWRFSLSLPSASDPEWPRVQHEQAIRFLRTKFSQHLHGPCGASRCGWDNELKKVPPEDRGFVALRRCVIKANGGYWRQFPDAVRLYLSLPPHKQREIDKLGHLRGRRHWPTLLDIIERDQRVFRFIVENKLSTGLIKDLESARRTEKWQQLRKISGNMHLSRLRELYSAYHSQALLLLGKLTPLDQLEKRPSSRRLARTLKERHERTQAGRGSKMWVVREWQTSPRPLFRRQRSILLQVNREEQRGEAPPPKQKVPICQDWPEVFSWFALTLRNLRRYSQGHPPLPWPTEVEKRRRDKHRREPVEAYQRHR